MAAVVATAVAIVPVSMSVGKTLDDTGSCEELKSRWVGPIRAFYRRRLLRGS